MYLYLFISIYVHLKIIPMFKDTSSGEENINVTETEHFLNGDSDSLNSSLPNVFTDKDKINQFVTIIETELRCNICFDIFTKVMFKLLFISLRFSY
jgi:hypothetical protein